MKTTYVWVPVLLACSTACDWRPFGDLEKNTPVVELKRPGSFKEGFGATVTAATSGDQTLIAVSGSPGQSPVAAFQLGDQESIGADAVDTGGCDNSAADSRCGVANQIAGMGRAQTGAQEEQLCFVLGIGLSPTDPSAEGLVVRCADRTEYTLAIPKKVTDTVLPARDLNGVHQPLFLATDPAEAPALVAGSPNQGLAWFYGVGSNKPVLIDTPTADADQQFGSAVAVVRLASGADGARLLAVAAKGTSHVWLFRTDDGLMASSVGCLGGKDGLGLALTSGDVDKDGVDELVVSDSGNKVYVISGASLAQLAADPNPTCTAPTGLLATLSCDSADCANSGFGTALAVGDLDGDGDGEVIVGAPTMKVRERAGAVLLYDVESGANIAKLSDTMFMSSAKKGDELGVTVAAAWAGDRSVVVAGGSGGAKAAVFFCSSLVPQGLRGVRCE